MQPFSNVASEDQNSFGIRKNSSASSSVVTLQRAPSLNTSRSRTRGQPTPTPQQDRQLASNGFTSFSNTNIVTPPKLRRQDSSEGIANLNRWSRSTSSSRENTSAQLASSRRMSFGQPGVFTFGTAESEKPSPKRLQKNRSLTAQSPASQLHPRRDVESSIQSANALPPILTLPGLQTSFNTENSSLDASPSTAGLLSAAVRSTVPDYFAAWDSAPRDSSRREPPQPRSASIDLYQPSGSKSTLNGGVSQQRVEEGTAAPVAGKGHSRNRSGKSSGSGRSSKQPSQKAMLSKALQKANTAVLLDNAQNFEGAMEAYSEACTLLQQVMQRSSGDEDKRKLEAIVSL